MVNELQSKIAFFKAKISQCREALLNIPRDAPYRDLRIQVLNNRIKLYCGELQKLQPENLKNWFV